MISLAITTYNRSGFVAESFIRVLDNELIDEIVIVDDNSSQSVYDNLEALIKRLNHVKIRLIRNSKNLGVFFNKRRAVGLCTQPWVLCFDSDNVMDNAYIDAIQGLDLQADVLYCPESLCDAKTGVAQWSYAEFNELVIDSQNVVNYIENVNFATCLNTGNNFFNRQRFLDAMALAEDKFDPSGADSIYICYLWLLNNGRIKVMPNASYKHRVHSDSWYLNHIEQGLSYNAMIYQKIRELNPPKGGFVVNKEFKLMIKTSYDYNQQAVDADYRWAILEELYNKNFLNATMHHTNVLPKKIHQIWLGGAIPEKYRLLTETWKALNPDWEHWLWTDKDIAHMDIPNRKLFDSLTNYGPKSDILRYHILNEYGGVYADTDFECLRSFNAFNNLEFFTGIGYPSKLELYPGLIGCTPHHPIMEQIVKDIGDIKSIPNNPTGVLETISSYFFTREFFKVVVGYTPRIVAFPHDYFYPFPNQKGYQKRDGRVHIKDCSYTLHHWAVSWIKK